MAVQSKRTKPVLEPTRPKPSLGSSPLQRLADDSVVVQRQQQTQQQADASVRSRLPANLRAGIERLSGVSLAGVQVHYGSSRPAELGAHAYADGNDIHLGPGQERHLPHEAWHVVQQRQGRVRPTAQVGERAINDDPTLEHEADRMGSRAARELSTTSPPVQRVDASAGPSVAVVQCVSNQEVETARNRCEAGTQVSIPLYSKAWKKKSNATKKQIWETVHAHEDSWYDNRKHIMLGDKTTPPAGYHSKAAGGDSNAVGTGDKNPAGVGGRGVYKQWTKARGQQDNGKLKISTFFPDNWDETKVRACCLLSHVGAEHQMTDQLELASPGNATYYPDTDLADPDRPA